MRHRTQAFTLIELLVVISIIALLIGILLPALGAARETARTSTCLSFIKQMALANQVYASDYKGAYVPEKYDGGFYQSGGPAANRWWHNNEGFRDNMSFDLVAGAPTFAWPIKYNCPSAEPDSLFGTSHAGVRYDLPTESYHWNRTNIRYADPANNADGTIQGFRERDLQEPSASMAMSDFALGTFTPKGNLIYASNIFNSRDRYVNEDTATAGVGAIAWRHANATAANAGYFDGHGASAPEEVYGDPAATSALSYDLQRFWGPAGPKSDPTDDWVVDRTW